MADLFSCPFCGGSDVSPSSFDVKCMECGAEMPGGTERAIAAWNRRAPSPDMREAVSLLETASVALWNAGASSTAREIDRYLDRVSPDSTAKIDVKLSEAKP